MFLPLDIAIMCPFLGYYISSTSQHPYSYTMPHTVLLRNSAIRFTLAAAVCKAPNTKLGNTLGRTHSYVGSSEDTNYHFNRASWLACSLQYICQLNISYIMPKLFFPVLFTILVLFQMFVLTQILTYSAFKCQSVKHKAKKKTL